MEDLWVNASDIHSNLQSIYLLIYLSIYLYSIRTTFIELNIYHFVSGKI